ncbi:PAS domain S-box protein [Dictyobacter formicarum]|uniref:histidine kinase n=1 Tax=Dictyobacter formicarum TaxID=2778368 RepID=A0ABQ3VU67_9CHLR|nr:PAS domain S-box protein [Dictyobacter formicarum]GHO89510.1 hypothetical protein KSZ_75160 [Dictyobacter formicarum]
MSNAKQTQRVTHASRGILLHILETLPGALFVIDDNATIVYANAHAQAMTGATPGEVVGTSLWRCAPQLVSPQLYQAVQQAKQTRNPTNVAYVSPATNSRLHVSLSPTDEGLALFFHDYPEPLHHQDALNRNERMYRDLLESFADDVTIVTPDGLILDINQHTLADVHRRREEVIGTPLTDLPVWSHDPAVQQQFRAAIAQASQGETVRFEASIHPRTGLSPDMVMTITSHCDARQQVEYLICASQDISERKRAENELRTLIDAIPQLVWVKRPDGFSEYHNQRWCDYTGMTPEQAQGDGWMQALHPDDRQRVQDAWQTSLHTGTLYERELRLRNGSTGAYRWFLARAVPFKNAQSQIVRWFGTVTDIDEQKRLEHALRQSQEQANTLMDSSIIGIDINEGEQIVDANDTFLRMTGYTREDLRAGNINLMQMTPPEYLARTLQAQQEFDTQQSVTPYEKEFVCKDGSRLPVVVGRVSLQSNPSQGIGFVLDNSARKELEQRKDDLINMASHELMTPLTAVKLQAQIVRRRLVKQRLHEAAADLLGLEAPVTQLEYLVGELLDISKIQTGGLEYRQEMVDLDALLREITDTMQYLNPSYTLVVRGAAQTTLIGDRKRLRQVFTNLIGNAIKYSPDAKTVEIDLSASPETVTISVRDYGLGIPRELRDKIFERFYRAAGPRQIAVPGLGMGLSIVAEIVKRHGGIITVDGTIGEGSTFTVTFPRTRDV